MLIRVLHLELLFGDPRFDQREILKHLSYVCPSVRSNHDFVRTQRGMDFKLCKKASTSHRLYRSAGSGTCHINQTGIPGSWAHAKSDSQQI